MKLILVSRDNSPTSLAQVDRYRSYFISKGIPIQDMTETYDLRQFLQPVLGADAVCILPSNEPWPEKSLYLELTHHLHLIHLKPNLPETTN